MRQTSKVTTFARARRAAAIAALASLSTQSFAGAWVNWPNDTRLSNGSEKHLSRYNTAGTSTTTIAYNWPNSTFCYLSRVGVRETDTSTEMSMCRVRVSGAYWILQASLGRTSDQDVFCSAKCFSLQHYDPDHVDL